FVAGTAKVAQGGTGCFFWGMVGPFCASVSAFWELCRAKPRRTAVSDKLDLAKSVSFRRLLSPGRRRWRGRAAPVVLFVHGFVLFCAPLLAFWELCRAKPN